MKIKKQEVLRYLGYRRKQELTAEVEALAELGIRGSVGNCSTKVYLSNISNSSE